MTKIISKNKTALVLILLSLLYFGTRLYHLLLLPIFTDESIYIYWAKEISTTGSQWFVSLGDGKPPLLIWIIAIFLKVIPHNLYLFSGRLPSVIAGAVSLFTIYFFTKDFFGSKRTGFIAAFLYILTPFFFFYDRMALFDSPLSSMLLLSAYFALKTAKSLRIKDAFLWGSILGLAFLFKPTAVVFLVLTPLFMLERSKDIVFKNWKRMLSLSLFAISISEFINNLQRVSHVYQQMVIKNSQFQVPLSDVLKNPFALVPNNLLGLFSWQIPYITLPLFAISVLGILFLFKYKWKKGLILFLFWFVPIYAFATFGRELFPRYILFTSCYLIIVAAFLVNYILKKNKYAFLILFLLCIALPIKFDYFLLTKPENAAFPRSDYDQYIASHPSGYGLAKVFSFLDGEIKKNKKVTIATQGTFGLYPYAFELYYWDERKVNIIPHYPLHDIDHDIAEAEYDSKVFIIFKDYQQIPKDILVDVLLKAEKPGKKDPIYVTKIKKK